MIIDCFPYFNEKELLELRYNVLKDYVDYFFIADGNYTHAGQEKPFTCVETMKELGNLCHTPTGSSRDHHTNKHTNKQ